MLRLERVINLTPPPAGQVLMSDELERVGAAMYDGKVPPLWAAASYPSEKPLGSYVSDLVQRVEMLTKWIAGGPPHVFWLGGFYFTHAFLTGVKQNYARRHKVPIDAVVFEFRCGEEAHVRIGVGGA